MIKMELTAILFSNKNLDLMCKLNKSCHKLSMNMVTCLNFVDLTIKVHKLKPQIVFFDINALESDNTHLKLLLKSNEFKNIKIIFVGSENEQKLINEFSDDNISFTTIADLEKSILGCVDVININAFNTMKDEYKSIETTNAVSSLLLSLGFLPKYSGYSYLKDIINNVVNNGGVISSLIHEQYPYIAVKFKTSPSNIERNIRNAIKKAYASNCSDKWDSILSNNGFNGQRPTNREFICMCVEKLLTNDVHSLAMARG